MRLQAFLQRLVMHCVSFESQHYTSSQLVKCQPVLPRRISILISESVQLSPFWHGTDRSAFIMHTMLHFSQQLQLLVPIEMSKTLTAMPVIWTGKYRFKLVQKKLDPGSVLFDRQNERAGSFGMSVLSGTISNSPCLGLYSIHNKCDQKESWAGNHRNRPTFKMN